MGRRPNSEKLSEEQIIIQNISAAVLARFFLAKDAEDIQTDTELERYEHYLAGIKGAYDEVMNRTMTDFRYYPIAYIIGYLAGLRLMKQVVKALDIMHTHIFQDLRSQRLLKDLEAALDIENSLVEGNKIPVEITTENSYPQIRQLIGLILNPDQKPILPED